MFTDCESWMEDDLQNEERGKETKRKRLRDNGSQEMEKENE